MLTKLIEKSLEMTFYRSKIPHHKRPNDNKHVLYALSHVEYFISALKIIRKKHSSRSRLNRKKRNYKNRKPEPQQHTTRQCHAQHSHRQTFEWSFEAVEPKNEFPKISKDIGPFFRVFPTSYVKVCYFIIYWMEQWYLIPVSFSLFNLINLIEIILNGRIWNVLQTWNGYSIYFFVCAQPYFQMKLFIYMLIHLCLYLYEWIYVHIHTV